MRRMRRWTCYAGVRHDDDEDDSFVDKFNYTISLCHVAR